MDSGDVSVFFAVGLVGTSVLWFGGNHKLLNDKSMEGV